MRSDSDLPTGEAWARSWAEWVPEKNDKREDAEMRPVKKGKGEGANLQARDKAKGRTGWASGRNAVPRWSLKTAGGEEEEDGVSATQRWEQGGARGCLLPAMMGSQGADGAGT